MRARDGDPVRSRRRTRAKGSTGKMATRERDYLVSFVVARDGNQYSALCYEYNVATCARTVEEAIDDLMAATVGYIETFLEQGKEPEPRPASRELLLEFLN